LPTNRLKAAAKCTVLLVVALSEAEILDLESSDEWVTKGVAGRKLGVTGTTIRNWASKGEVRAKLENGAWLHHLGDCATRARSGPSDLGDGSEQNKIVGQAASLIALNQRHMQQMMEPDRVSLKVLERQIERLTADLDKRDAEIARLQEKLLDQLETRERMISQDHVRTIELDELKVRREREQEEHEKSQQRERDDYERSQRLKDESFDVLRNLAPIVLSQVAERFAPGALNIQEGFLTRLVAELTREQVQELANSGIFPQEQVAMILEFWEQINRAREEAGASETEPAPDATAGNDAVA